MGAFAGILLLLLAIALPVVATGADLSPLPDPADREAFQRLELERHRSRIEAFGRIDPKRLQTQEQYDVIDYHLEFDLRNHADRLLLGVTRIHLRVVEGPLEHLLFDLHPAMQVDSVFVDGVVATHGRLAADLWVQPADPIPEGETAKVRIAYHGNPRDTIGFDAFEWSLHGETPVVSTLSEPLGAREWWPCKDRPDDKADSVDVLIRVPDWMVATSNGMLVEEQSHADSSRTFHWKHRYPITTYLVSICATNYERIDDLHVTADGNTLLLEHFVYPEHRSAAIEDLSITSEVLTVLAGRFGDYPFPEEKYGHSIFPWSGAMEHQTNTSYGAVLINGQHTFDWILVHEAAHQWWGDWVSPADWRDIWLNEGFASYAEALWFEEVGGAETYRDYMVNRQRVRDPSGPIYDPEDLFSGNTVYNKGAWVVHMLRGVLGDDLFWQVLDEYGRRAAFRSTTTAEFQSITEEIAEQELDWFFDPWIYGINRPEYAVSLRSDPQGDLWSVAIHLDQTQGFPEFFNMPVEIRIDLEDGRSIKESFVNDPNHLDVEYLYPSRAVGVTVDPDSWILKTVVDESYTLNITTTELPNIAVGDTLSLPLVARGGDPPHFWSTGGTLLPSALELEPKTGILTGTPSESGTFAFTIFVRDENGLTDAQSFWWEIAEGPVDDDPGVTTKLDLSVWPVAPSETIREIEFKIDGSGTAWVNLDLFSSSGRRVRSLWDGPAPNSAVFWNGEDERGKTLPSGVYWARLEAPAGSVTRRVIWLN